MAPDLLEIARGLHHVLPPKPGGPVALLERNPGADVVFCAHAGYEGAATFRDLVEGRTIGRTIRVSFRRVPYAQIPKGREALTRWLFAEWRTVDAWVGAHLPAEDLARQRRRAAPSAAVPS